MERDGQRSVNPLRPGRVHSQQRSERAMDEGDGQPVRSGFLALTHIARAKDAVGFRRTIDDITAGCRLKRPHAACGSGADGRGQTASGPLPAPAAVQGPEQGHLGPWSRTQSEGLRRRPTPFLERDRCLHQSGVASTLPPRRPTSGVPAAKQPRASSHSTACWERRYPFPEAASGAVQRAAVRATRETS